MPSIVLTRNQSRLSLQPFSLIREVADIRMGFFTFRERWEKISGSPCRYEDEPGDTRFDGPHLTVPENHLPMPLNDNVNIEDYLANSIPIDKPWQIAQLNRQALLFDFKLAIENQSVPDLPDEVQCAGNYPVFIDPSARIEHCYINSSEGPVYIDQKTTILAGSMLRGPLYIGEGAVVKMGAAIYGATTIGPHSVAGGEIKNVVIMGYSNKAHDGYLGDSVVGEWCNIGAGTISSNMKNNAGMVRVWNMSTGKFEDAGDKCGLLMGDLSRAAINTSFNTGTLTGICVNIFDSQQLTPKFIPNFSWGSGGTRYDLYKAIQEIHAWMSFKGRELSPEMIQKLTSIYQNQFVNQ